MANFVLVHGAWHGGWCWRDVVAPLARAGHRVFAPRGGGVQPSPAYSQGYLYPDNARFLLNAVGWLLETDAAPAPLEFATPAPTGSPTPLPSPTPTPIPPTPTPTGESSA